VVSVVGGSGAGKSTLLKSIVGLLPPRSGEVLLFGRNLYALETSERQALLRRTGMLFQHDALFGSMTILENLLLPLQELTDLPSLLAQELARVKLALVGLRGYEHRLPSQLSGGQRKRVALARATMLDPDILFCDEPTSGLDPLMSAQIDHSLRRFREVFGVGIVAITHDVDSVRAISDRAVMLARGRLVAEGTASDLLSSEDPTVRGFFHREIPANHGMDGD
jgi:phospholipid/cholesterol/gamma-HCH transport system ATP-binding protein